MSPDALVTLAVTCSVLASLNALRSGRGKHYVCAAVLTGVTASLKYNGALVGLTIPVAAFLRDGRRAFRNPWLYATPFIAGQGDTLAYYSRYLLDGEGLGALLALAGIVLGLVRRNRGVLLLCSFSVVYFAFINSFVARNGRTIVPLIPTLLIIAAWCAAKCLRWVEVRVARRYADRPPRLALLIATVVMLAAYPLAWSIQRTRPLLLKDNRELATAWVDANIPPRAHIAIERYSCYVSRKRYVIKGERNLSDLDPSWLRSHVDYLIFAGDSFNRYLSDPGRYHRQAAKYRRLFREFTLLRVFDDPRRGAEIRIYRAGA